MKAISYLLTAACVFSLVAHRSVAGRPASGVQYPIARRLSMDFPGVICGVFWSASRNDTYASAIQISFIPVRQGERQPPHPNTQVWLLKRDGTVVVPTNAPPDTDRIHMGRSVTDSISYAYNRSAAADAVAVVVLINERFFVERLKDSK